MIDALPVDQKGDVSGSSAEVDDSNGLIETVALLEIVTDDPVEEGGHGLHAHIDGEQAGGGVGPGIQRLLEVLALAGDVFLEIRRAAGRERG